MDISKPPLWTKNFIVISLASFFFGLIFFLTVTTITVYVTEEFGASNSKAGLAASIFVIGILSSRLLSGKYLEIIGRKKLLYIGVFLSFFVSLLYFPIENLNSLIFVRIIHGVVIGMALTVLQTSVIDIIPKERQGEGISYYTLSFILATAIGPFLGGLIIQNGDMRMIFVACTIISSITVILSLLAVIPSAKVTKEQLEEMKSFHFKNFFEIKALPISVIMGLLAFSYSSLLSFLTSYTMEIDLMTASSFFFIVYSICILLSRPFTGKLLDLKGDNIVMYPAFLLLAAGLFVISQVEHGVTLLVAGALIGLGYGNLQSATQAIAVKESPPYRIGLATSTFFICVEGGTGTGPFLLGFLVSTIGYRNMYLTLGFLILVCTLLYYLLHGKKKTFEKQLSQKVTM